MSNVLKFVDENLGRFRAEMYDFLRIPSISAKSEHDGDMRRAAEWLSDRLRDAGLEPSIHPTPGHPVVLGEWRGAGERRPDDAHLRPLRRPAPRAAGRVEVAAFEPTERDGKVVRPRLRRRQGPALHAREGAGGAPAGQRQAPRSTWCVLAEGEEEVGSANLVPFVEENNDRLACDHVVISDSDMFDEGHAVGALLPARPRLLRAVGAGRAQRPALGPVRRARGRTPATRWAKIIASFHDAERPHRHRRLLRRRAAIGTPRPASRSGSLPFDEEAYRKEIGGARPWEGEGLQHAGAPLDPPHLRRQRPPVAATRARAPRPCSPTRPWPRSASAW